MFLRNQIKQKEETFAGSPLFLCTDNPCYLAIVTLPDWPVLPSWLEMV